MKSLLVLVLMFSIGVSSENERESDSIERLVDFVEEQLAIRNTTLNVVNSFALSVESVVVWRQRVNNMTLSGKDSKAAQVFLDYVRYTFKIEDTISKEMLFANLPRFYKFKTFYDYAGSLSEKQIRAANRDIEDAIRKTSEIRKRIEKYISNVHEKMDKIKEKILDLKKRMVAVISLDLEELQVIDDTKGKLFQHLKDAAKMVMDMITGKRITKSLMKPMTQEIKETIKIEDKLVKQLNKICLTI